MATNDVYEWIVVDFKLSNWIGLNFDLKEGVTFKMNIH